MMVEILPLLVVAAIVGAGLVTGLLFAFANFALDALAELKPQSGMFAMQRINQRIQNPVFLLLFIGTSLACAAIVFVALVSTGLVGRWWLVAGGASYLLGPLGVTAMHNVPLNNRLAAADWSNADRVWPSYRRRWRFWNEIRTALGVLSLGALAVGAVALQI